MPEHEPTIGQQFQTPESSLNEDIGREEGILHTTVDVVPVPVTSDSPSSVLRSPSVGTGEVFHASVGGRTELVRLIDKEVASVPVKDGENWRDYANCKGMDPELFFPERGDSTREAKQVCRGCEVRHDCLEFALESGEKHGILGGLSERERRRIRRQRRQNSI